MADDKETAAQAAPSIPELRAAVQAGMRAYRAFRFGDEALAVIENYDQVRAERVAAADAAQTRLDAVKADLATAEADTKAAKDEAKALRAKAKADAEQRTSQAQAQADAVLADAKAKADAMTAQHEAMAADLLAKSQELAALQGKIDEAQAIIARAEAARAALAAIPA